MPGQSADSFDSSHVRQLSRMLDLDATSETGNWSPEEFSAIFEHQLAAPLESELAEIDPQMFARLGAWRRQSEHPLRSFSDLFTHPYPPVELLDTARRFAKRARSSADGRLPDDVATVLYFACIAVGMTRCNQRITRLDDAALRAGFRWALEQPWLTASVRRVLEEATASLDSADG